MRDWNELPANAQTVAVIESCIDYLQKEYLELKNKTKEELANLSIILLEKIGDGV